jgi:hypothetical protein
VLKDCPLLGRSVSGKNEKRFIKLCSEKDFGRKSEGKGA